MFSKHKPVDIIRELAADTRPEATEATPSLKKLKGIKAVLFDVYGTLFQSAAGDISEEAAATQKAREKLIRESIEQVGFRFKDKTTPVAELFYDTIRAEQDIRRENGTPHPEVDIHGVWEDLLGQLEAYEVIQGRTTQAKIRQLATLFEMRVNPVSPMPQAQEVIEGCLDKDLSLGLLSNAQAITPLLFEALLDGSPHDMGFEEILCIYSYEHHVAKPGAAIFEIAAERLQAFAGIAPAQVLFVGNDMLNDVAAGQKLGFKTALFAGDKRSLRLREDHPECKGVKPDLVLTELSQLLKCL